MSQRRVPRKPQLAALFRVHVRHIFAELLEITHRGLANDMAFVGLQLPGQNVQQCGFSCAILPHNANAIPFIHMQRFNIQNFSFSEIMNNRAGR